MSMTEEDRRRASWEDLNMTKDELTRIGDALKKEEFRKLLLEYAEEISDPANKKLYEEEITQLERERGVDCTFINPEPGYVIKSSIDGQKKAFINVCKNEKIGKPTSTPSKNSSGKHGLNWSLPYSQAPPREDLDKKNIRCTVFDVVFHPDTHHLAEKNPQFKKMLTDTAMDAVEGSYKVKLDRKNVRFPKLAFKGPCRPAVIRKKSSNPPPQTDDEDLSFPYPYPVEPVTAPEIPQKSTPKITEVKKDDDDSPFTTPKHSIKYRNNVDIQEFTYDENAKMNAAIPKELVISIFLPLLKTTADVTLDVHGRWIELKSEKIAKYFLHLPLPYEVNDALGNARFDQTERKLVINLPVKPSLKTVADINRFDSGNESDLHTLESDESNENKPNPKIQVLSENSSDIPEMTKIVAEQDVPTSFLNPDLHYSPVNYTCNIANDVMAFTLHVKNVDPESVKHIFVNPSSIHLRFTSVGAGFFPIHHAFFLKLRSCFSFIKDRASVDTWDNNVIVQLALNPCDVILTEYFVGVDEESVQKQELSEPTAIALKLAEMQLVEEDSGMNVQVVKNSPDEVILELTRIEEQPSAEVEIVSEPEPVEAVVKLRKPLPFDSEKTRYYSESSGEELSSSSLTKKGILKKRASVCRSLSESNVDDFSSSTSSLDPFPATFGSDLCIVEEGTEEERAAAKKVHFNEKIAKKVFRTDSCILSQKKKNQRKNLNKRRAQERRASESETSEGDVEKAKEKKVKEDNVCSSPELVSKKPTVVEISAEKPTAASLPTDKLTITELPDQLTITELPADKATVTEHPVEKATAGDHRAGSISMSESEASQDAASNGGNARGKRHRKHRKGKRNVGLENDGKLSSEKSREGSPEEAGSTMAKFLATQDNGGIGGKNVQKKCHRNQKGRKQAVIGNEKAELLGEKRSSSSDSREDSPDLIVEKISVSAQTCEKKDESKGKGNTAGERKNQKEANGEVPLHGDVTLDKTDILMKKEPVITKKKGNVIKETKDGRNKGIIQNLETQNHKSMKIEELGFKNELIFDLDM